MPISFFGEALLERAGRGGSVGGVEGGSVGRSVGGTVEG